EVPRHLGREALRRRGLRVLRALQSCLRARRAHRDGEPHAAGLTVAGRGEERDARFSRPAAGAQAADRSGAPDPRPGWPRPAAADPRPRYGARHGRGRGPRPRGSGDGHQVRRADAQHHPRRGRCLDPERGASRRRGVSRELSVAAETFVARLDRVPLNRFHWRLLILSGLGWMFDAMDVLMLSFLLTPIRAEFKLDPTGVGLVAITVVASYGWRWGFAVGALPALYVAYLRRALPESPRFLAEKGRAPEADAVVRRVERAGGGALLTLAPAVAPARAGRTSISELFSGRYARRTVMLWILWFGVVLTYYGIFLLIPSILAGRGLSQVRSNEFFFLSTLAQVPGYFSAAWLVERWGRKWTLVAYLLGTAVSAFMFGNYGTGSDNINLNGLFIWAALLSFFNLGAWGVLYTYTPELYPTSVRATGSGVAAAVGRSGGIIGPYLTPVLVPAIAVNGTFALFMALLLITAAAAALLG